MQPPVIPPFLMGRTPLDFSPITNALAQFDASQRDRRNFEEKQRQFNLQNALAQSAEGRAAAMHPLQLEKARVDITNAGQTTDIREYEYAKRTGFGGNFAEWVKQKKAQSVDFGKNPIYGTDAQGNPVLLQASSAGGVKQAELPPGVKLSTGIERSDGGTHWVIHDKRSGAVVGTVPKDVQGVAREREVGEGLGKARVELPKVESTADNIIRYIDSVAGDPDLDKMIGYRGYLPNVSTGARTLQSKIAQLTGQAFTAAFQDLKGGGAITEQEGRAATAALTRLQEMVQSGADYREALRDFKNEVNRLREVARRKAGVGGPNGNAGFGGQITQPGPQAPAGWSIQRVD